MGDPVFIAGPTASGKSAVALEVAQRLKGEIISVDSMQVYRGLDLGTSKPSAEERAAVPHHLIDILDLTESFDAASFVGEAREDGDLLLVEGACQVGGRLFDPTVDQGIPGNTN